VKRVRETDTILHTTVTRRTRVLPEEKLEIIYVRLATTLKEIVAGQLRSKQTCLRYQYELLKDKTHSEPHKTKAVLETSKVDRYKPKCFLQEYNS